MTILDKILAHKYKEVEERKALHPIQTLEQSAFFVRTPRSLKASIIETGKSGIIAEIKRKSPSKGIINPNVSIKDIATGYEQAGASALSILTDTQFFGGTNEDILIARPEVACPILRKDFVVDEYQIIEAKAIGADAILLIAAALEPDKIRQLRSFARSLRLEVLLEVHDEEELKSSLDMDPDMMGINNRNLKTFDVDVSISKRLSRMIPDTIVKVSESGIESIKTIQELEGYEFKGFLMGQRFMESEKPGDAARIFIKQLIELRKGK